MAPEDHIVDPEAVLAEPKQRIMPSAVERARELAMDRHAKLMRA